ncbi:NAD(P)/FAD-dependent oxidoreductase [Nostocoides veronense]|uniref:FAD-dependent oxidoreductase n=1 Tax=Nostocoides veronense TaxID=330836 RepID=A0ABN2LQP9_9MICO
MSSVVVIGAGLAAAKVVEALREGDFDGSITLVGAEDHPPYERPGLSKDYLAGTKSADTLRVHEPQWYAAHDIEMRYADPATAIDRQAQRVTLASGEELAYDWLVLATGAQPRLLDLPGADLDGVVTLRSIEDSTRLRAALTRQARLVIIGGGWIGLEVAAAARNAGCEVTVLERESLPLYAVLGPTMSGYFADLHRKHGVDLRTEVRVESIEGADGQITGVRTSEGTIPADLVLVGVGAIPDTELAQAAGLDVDRGVVTDEHLRTSDQHILAAGDVARARHTSLGELRVEHWDNAIRQGKLAAYTILGRDESFDWQPYFFTDQYDLGMEYVGHAGADDQAIVRGDLESGAFIVFWVRDGVVRAAMNVNIWDVNDDLRAIVGSEVASDRLKDESIPLAELAASA